MTKGQRIALQADWWPAACRAQNWSVTDRNLRLRVCMWCVSLAKPSQHELLAAINSDRQPQRWLESTNDLDNKADIDAVKSCLLMLADDLKKTEEVGDPFIGSARRKRDLIRGHLKCLALYEERPRAFLAELVNDMFNQGSRLHPLTIRDLTDEPVYKTFKGRTHGQAEVRPGPSQLQRLLMRVAAVVNQKRNENILVKDYARLQGTEPLTIHEMKLSAGVLCDCAICLKIAARTGRALVPPLPVEEVWTDFDPELETVTDEFGGNSDPNEEGDQPF